MRSKYVIARTAIAIYQRWYAGITWDGYSLVRGIARILSAGMRTTRGSTIAQCAEHARGRHDKIQSD